MRRRLTFIALAGAAVTAGCLGSNVTADLGLPSGTYTLVSVDDVPLPFRGATTITVRGSLDLPVSGNYTLTQTDSVIAGGALSAFSSKGARSIQNGALLLVDENHTTYLGVIVSIDSLRMTVLSHTNLYVRK